MKTLHDLELWSGAFQHEGNIPPRYTCDGDDVSPPLEWSRGPDGTVSYALIVEDPDAPSGTWTHWVAWNIGARRLPESLPPTWKLDNGIRQGRNSWGTSGYRGPCPPSGTHRYVFRVHALDHVLGLGESAGANELREALAAHVLARGEIVGLYSRTR